MVEMSRLEQVLVYASESAWVLSLCYCRSWNIREGVVVTAGCVNPCQQFYQSFLAPSGQVAFEGTIWSLTFSSPLVSSVLVTCFVVSLLFLQAFWEYVVSAGVQVSLSCKLWSEPCSASGSRTTLIQAAWNPLLIRGGELSLLAAARLKTLLEKSGIL